MKHSKARHYETSMGWLTNETSIYFVVNSSDFSGPKLVVKFKMMSLYFIGFLAHTSNFNSRLSRARHSQENHGTKTNSETLLGAGYVSYFKVVFCVRVVEVCNLGSAVRYLSVRA